MSFGTNRYCFPRTPGNIGTDGRQQRQPWHPSGRVLKDTQPRSTASHSEGPQLGERGRWTSPRSGGTVPWQIMSDYPGGSQRSAPAADRHHPVPVLECIGCDGVRVQNTASRGRKPGLPNLVVIELACAPAPVNAVCQCPGHWLDRQLLRPEAVGTAATCKLLLTAIVTGEPRAPGCRGACRLPITAWCQYCLSLSHHDTTASLIGFSGSVTCHA